VFNAGVVFFCSGLQSWTCPKNHSHPTWCWWGRRSEPHYFEFVKLLVLQLVGKNELNPKGITVTYKIRHDDIGNNKKKPFVVPEWTVEWCRNILSYYAQLYRMHQM